MIQRLPMAILACCLLAGTALAGPEQPDHQPDRSNQKTSDHGAKHAANTSKLVVNSKASTTESVQSELSKIVELCASEHEAQFEKEWRQYVNKKSLKGAELKETIAWVSDEAAAQREQERAAGETGATDEEWIEKRRQLMNEVAEKALNPAR